MTSDITGRVIAGRGWRMCVWRLEYLYVQRSWGEPEQLSARAEQPRTLSEWLSLRLWCACWWTTSVTLWMLLEGMCTRLVFFPIAACFNWCAKDRIACILHTIISDKMVETKITAIYFKYLIHSRIIINTDSLTPLLFLNESAIWMNKLNGWFSGSLSVVSCVKASLYF